MIEGILWTIGLIGIAATCFLLPADQAPLRDDCPRSTDASRERWPYSF